MFKGNFVAGTQVAANTDIPVRTVLNTNNRILNTSTDGIEILVPGLYKATANLVVTSTAATPITAQIYADGVAVPGAIGEVVPAAIGDTLSIPIQDVIRVFRTNAPERANITIRCNIAVTVAGGNIIVGYER